MGIKAEMVNVGTEAPYELAPYVIGIPYNQCEAPIQREVRPYQGRPWLNGRLARSLLNGRCTVLVPRVLLEGHPFAARHEALRAASFGPELGELVPHHRCPPQERPMDEGATLEVPHVALQCDQHPPVLFRSDHHRCGRRRCRPVAQRR